jgi:hypothetical protein
MRERRCTAYRKQEQGWDGAKGSLAHHKLLGSSERTEEVEGVQIDGSNLRPERKTTTSICRFRTSREAWLCGKVEGDEGGANGVVGDKGAGRNRWI